MVNRGDHLLCQHLRMIGRQLLATVYTPQSNGTLRRVGQAEALGRIRFEVDALVGHLEDRVVLGGGP